MVLDTGTYTATVLVAVILASAARTIIPWLAKRQSDETAGLPPRPFSIAYLYTAILGAVPVMVGAILLLPSVLTQVQNTGTQLMVFVTGFGLAYATTDLVNRNVSTLGISVPLSQIRNLRLYPDPNVQHDISGVGGGMSTTKPEAKPE